MMQKQYRERKSFHDEKCKARDISDNALHFFMAEIRLGQALYVSIQACMNSIAVRYVKQSVKALRNAAHPESFVYDQMRETPASNLCCVLFSYDTAYDAEHETESAFHPLSKGMIFSANQ